jgi:hypothetical protein
VFVVPSVARLAERLAVGGGTVPA